MHSRRRSPGGGGIRSNSMGMGGLAAARISPETSLPRNLGYNRSFGGRMQPPKPYLAPQPLPPRRADILMEAGRLATEYLVFKGVLPPNVLSEKWANGSFSKNNQIMEFQMAAEGRPSALARLGNGVHDGGSRNPMRGGRRRAGSMRYFDHDWSRDNRKNDFFPERAQTSTDVMEYDDDFGYGYGQIGHEDRLGDLDSSAGGASKAISHDLPSKSDIAGYSEPVVHNYEVPNEAGSKASASTTGKEVPMAADCEASNASNEMKISSIEIGEVKDSTSNDGLEKQSDLEDFSMDHLPMEGEILNKNRNDLLSFCSFAKVPTRARSSLTVKGSKGETPPMTKEETICDISPLEGPNVLKEEDPSESTFANHTQNSTSLDSNVSTALSIQTAEDVGALSSVMAVEKDECTIHEQASEQGLSEFRRCNSVLKDKGDKRALEDDDLRESKKPREWTSTAVASADEYSPFHNFSANPSHSHMSTAPDVEVVEIVDQEGLFSVSLLPRGTSESGIESKEEKQLFPGSFKICDLNLMESSDTTGTHDSDPVYGLPSTLEAKKGVQVDVDLTISSSCNRSDDCDESAADAKEAVIVEVEDDSAKEDEDFDNSERKTEIAHSSLESFPNHMVSTGDLPDAQDGYGLMISELLGNDISNCSSVPPDIASLHTEMGLHNGAEILDDDDPIYLSLGEIPISFLGWEQPPQQFEKPF